MSRNLVSVSLIYAINGNARKKLRKRGRNNFSNHCPYTHTHTPFVGPLCSKLR